MQACGGARNTLAAEVSLPVTESSSLESERLRPGAIGQMLFTSGRYATKTPRAMPGHHSPIGLRPRAASAFIRSAGEQ